MIWNSADKKITDYSPIIVRQELKWGGGELSYPSPLLFSWAQFVLSIARTTCLRFAIPEFSHEERSNLAMAHGALLAADLDLFLDPTTLEFLFTTKIEILDDEQRTSIAARMGAAVAGLVMENMGFYWSANARELKLDRSKAGKNDSKKIPDFVYDPAGQHGFLPKSVVVVEAKGSLSKKRATQSAIRRLAQEAYNAQVRHVVGAAAENLNIASGYAIAFGTIPGAKVSTLAIASPQHLLEQISTPVKAYALSAAMSSGISMEPEKSLEIIEDEEEEEEEIEIAPARHGGSGDPPSGGFGREEKRMPVNGRIAYANYESVFLLCGALNIARALRQILSGRSIEELEPERLVEDFWIFESSGKQFLIGLHWNKRQLPFNFFAIYAPTAEDVLVSVPVNRDRTPETLSLRSSPFSGADGEAVLALQGDGLAAIDRNALFERRRWDIAKGLWI